MSKFTESLNSNTDAGVIAVLAAQSVGEQYTIGGQHPYAVIPEGFRVADLESYLPKPVRIREAVVLTTAVSFIDYWQKFATDASVIFAEESAKKFRAVFDYHQLGMPDNCAHRATLQLQHSEEWKCWVSFNKESFSQVEFANFIEDHILDIREPAGAELLEVAKTLNATKKLTFRSGIELQNGATQLTYHEVIDGQAGTKGDLLIPTRIKLGLRIFKGCEAYEVNARLRYRINDEGRLTFTYLIDNLDHLLEDAFEQIKKQIQLGCVGSAGQMYQV
jgi:uncharacterized protein YfdQ (DUF2303 family)